MEESELEDYEISKAATRFFCEIRTNVCGGTFVVGIYDEVPSRVGAGIQPGVSDACDESESTDASGPAGCSIS